MSAANQRYQNMTFKCKQHCAPFQPMKRGFFIPSRREFRHKIRKKDVKK